MDSNILEKKFDQAMEDIYIRAKKECNYNATRFFQMLIQYRGLGAAKHLLVSDEIQYGFTELWLCKRLDLTVEAHVLKPEFKGLFTQEELKRAESRLKAHGWKNIE